MKELNTTITAKSFLPIYTGLRFYCGSQLTVKEILVISDLNIMHYTQSLKMNKTYKEKGTFFFNIRTLSLYTGLSYQSVVDALCNLVKEGLIQLNISTDALRASIADKKLNDISYLARIDFKLLQNRITEGEEVFKELVASNLAYFSGSNDRCYDELIDETKESDDINILDINIEDISLEDAKKFLYSEQKKLQFMKEYV